MSQQLISHSPDLKRLQDEGYEMEIQGGYLIVHHIPYLNSAKGVSYGTLVSTLTLNANQTTRPDHHVIYFAGDFPCHNNGQPITAIQHGTAQQILGGINVKFSFSNKPLTGYADYYDKITTYSRIISSPAKAVDENATEKTYKIIPSPEQDSVFHYVDTNSSRANIARSNSKFEGQRIAIVGLGGTGAYILDLVAKTPVKEIHLFDGDLFLQHNAFRSPGAATIGQLAEQQMKAAYFAGIYSSMHRNVIAHSHYLDDSNLESLNGMSYVFICVDRNSVRVNLMQALKNWGISFIDTGLGINLVDDQLIGSVRVTTATACKNDHLPLRVATTDGADDEYATNIQIADLNALNAALAVIKWKKLAGFYQDLEEEHHCAYAINVSKLFNEDSTA
jgi:hypothetical protein